MMGLEIVGGLIYLLLAGDLLVRGSVALARRARIPPVIVGLTIVAFGTSAPELFVSLQAAVQGHAGISIGNVVGSNIANALLVLGVPALLAPTAATRDSTRVDILWMLGATLLFMALCFAGPLDTWKGAVLLVLFVAMILHSLLRSRGETLREEFEEELEHLLGLPSQRRMITLFLGLGAVGLPLGAYLMVDGAVQLAEALGVTDAVIGLSVVALGTSLPELATTVAAAIRRHADVAIGNVLGSNLFNLLGIMGTVVVLSPEVIPVPPAFLRFDLFAMLFSSLGLAWLAWRGGAVSRAAGVLLTGAYLLYLVVLYTQPALRGA